MLAANLAIEIVRYGPLRGGTDIMGGNATGDKKRVDAAIAHHAHTDMRSG
jgi:hypothetical protein